MIHKTFFGKHIDLSKLVSVSDAYVLMYPSGFSPDHTSNHVYSVGFSMQFQLMDTPVEFRRRMVDQDETFRVKLVNRRVLNKLYTFVIERGFKLKGEGYVLESDWDPENSKDLLAVYNLQVQVDELIAVWESHSTQEYFI